MIRKHHLQLIAGHSVRHGIRGGAGLVAILLTLVIGLMLASVVISPLEEIDKLAAEHGSTADRDELRAEVIKITRKAIDWAVEPSAAQLDYLTSDQPAAVSAILVLLFLVTPLLSCLGAFNQTSGDIASKGLRFLLIRTERPNIFLGRFVGTLLFSAVIYAALFVILLIYMSLRIHVHSPGEMIPWLLQGYLRLLLFSMPYVALCAWISASIDSPFGSLVIALLIAYLLPLVVSMGAKINDSVGYLQYVTPWGYKWWLLQPLGGSFLGGLAVMVGFTGLFTWVGLRHFKTRDL